MSDVVTMDQLRDLVKAEKIKPEELFDAEGLRDATAAARADGYAEGLFEARKRDGTGCIGPLDEPKKDEPEADPETKYINPASNPFIKTEDS